MLHYKLEIVGDESLTVTFNSIDHNDEYDKFHVNLLFDRFFHRPLCTHMGYPLTN